MVEGKQPLNSAGIDATQSSQDCRGHQVAGAFEGLCSFDREANVQFLIREAEKEAINTAEAQLQSTLVHFRQEGRLSQTDSQGELCLGGLRDVYVANVRATLLAVWSQIGLGCRSQRICSAGNLLHLY